MTPMDRVKRKVILNVFRKYRGNTTKTAQDFEVSRRTLLRWVEKYEIREEVEEIRKQ